MSTHPWIIRALEPEDYADWREIRSCSLVQRWTLALPYTSLREARERMENPPEGFIGLGAEVGGRIVGTVGVHTEQRRRRHTCVLGIMVHDDYARRGIGDSLLAAAIDLAENWLNMHRLELSTLVDNEPAIALYRKHGFKLEARMRDYVYRDGEYVDGLMFARIRGEAA